DFQAADLSGEGKDDRLIVQVMAKGDIRHEQVFSNERFRQFGLARWEIEVAGRFRRQNSTALTVIIGKALSEVVEQKCQVKRSLLADTSVCVTQRPHIGQELRCPFHGSNTVLVDRVLMIVIELNETS